jgi:hypothetical protein
MSIETNAEAAPYAACQYLGLDTTRKSAAEHPMDA